MNITTASLTVWNYAPDNPRSSQFQRLNGAPKIHCYFAGARGSGAPTWERRKIEKKIEETGTFFVTNQSLLSWRMDVSLYYQHGRG
ncbi:hypothetical protein PABG_11602 [Paracoccidioides brasiliensis Pb03]|nr:hypothetical protein PABG_11602 [Paracoccidioides brasiliensis Pb03]